MRLSTDINPAAPLANPPILGEESISAEAAERYADYKIIRRNGSVVGFEPDKIAVAMTKAFLAVSGSGAAASAGVREKVKTLTEAVVQSLVRRHPAGGTFHIEDVQDQVELAMMRAGEHQVARSYVLYREERARERAKRVQEQAEAQKPQIHVTIGGAREPLDTARLEALIASACENLHEGADVDPKKILDATLRDLYDGVPLDEVHKCAILAARMLIEQDPDYTYVTARLLLHTIRREVLGEEVTQAEMSTRYAEYFPTYIGQGVKAQLLDEKLYSYDLKRLGAALKPQRDLQFNYLGLQTLYDRYFLHVGERRIELPQAFFMRVAMGLALNEINREERAIEFYNVLSTFDFMSSTPTLFNSGTQRSQLSSCYLTTVADDLDGIYEAIKENALLSKFAGGLGNDWTPVRALGSYIKGTNGKSQGVVPFLKVVSDTAVAVNQGGKRKGAVCCYLETWHLDIEEFLELRKNTGDDRRRTHDMNTANWVPDLFMRRVMEGGEWTLFSPSDVPDLHDKFGKDFEAAYTIYEKKAARGEIKLHKKIPAQSLWRKMLTMLFETGHPWITFKDASNIRSPRATWAWCTRPTCAPRSRSTPTPRNRGLQPGLGEPARPRPQRQARPREAQEDHRHGDAHAGQRDRHQLLRGPQGARFQQEAPPRGPRHHGLPGRAARAAHPVRLGRRDGVRGPLDGSGVLLRLLGLDRAFQGAGTVLHLRRLALGPRHPPARFAQAPAGGARRLRRSRHVGVARLADAARPHQGARDAQLQLRGDRADGDHLQHHRRVRVDRAQLPEPVREVEPLG
jgi:ribonucleoside-diphosphate reductase alpha chain